MTALEGWFLLLIRWLLGGGFVVAAAAKMGNPVAFGDSIGGFKLLHQSILLEGALLFLWLEMVCGVLLILGLWARAAAALICGLLCVFFIAMALAVARGLDIDCGCFGALFEEGVGYGSLLRVLAMLLMGLIAFRFGPGRLSLGRGVARLFK